MRSGWAVVCGRGALPDPSSPSACISISSCLWGRTLPPCRSSLFQAWSLRGRAEPRCDLYQPHRHSKIIYTHWRCQADSRAPLLLEWSNLRLSSQSWCSCRLSWVPAPCGWPRGKPSRFLDSHKKELFTIFCWWFSCGREGTVWQKSRTMCLIECSSHSRSKEVAIPESLRCF